MPIVFLAELLSFFIWNPAVQNYDVFILQDHLYVAKKVLPLVWNSSKFNQFPVEILDLQAVWLV